MKINYKKLLLYIVITFLIGSFFAIFTSNNETYRSLNKIIEVPGIVFPIVWSILYLLMSISAYIVSESNDRNKNKALKIYFIQLIVNSLWTLIFFGFKLYAFGFIWILLLISLVVLMIYNFYKIKSVAGYINLPYILWLIFAAFLNISIVILN
ncbi:MAG: tryptophan-rich sensory protein [Firmicutes bacterium]|nr:tryptophan-rich sensory protein [Bacillota bacterium]